MKHLKRYRKTYKKQRTEIQDKISLVKKMYEEATEFKDSALQTVCLKILKQHFLQIKSEENTIRTQYTQESQYQLQIEHKKVQDQEKEKDLKKIQEKFDKENRERELLILKRKEQELKQKEKEIRKKEYERKKKEQEAQEKARRDKENEQKLQQQKKKENEPPSDEAKDVSNRSNSNDDSELRSKPSTGLLYSLSLI